MALAACVLAASITPSADVVTQSARAGPMIGLYLLGVLIAWIFGKKKTRDQEEDEESAISEGAGS